MAEVLHVDDESNLHLLLFCGGLAPENPRNAWEGCLKSARDAMRRQGWGIARNLEEFEGTQVYDKPELERRAELVARWLAWHPDPWDLREVPGLEFDIDDADRLWQEGAGTAILFAIELHDRLRLNGVKFTETESVQVGPERWVERPKEPLDVQNISPGPPGPPAFPGYPPQPIGNPEAMLQMMVMARRMMGEDPGAPTLAPPLTFDPELGEPFEVPF